MKREIFSKALYVCEYPGCFKRCTDLAHKIANTIANKKLAKRIILETYKHNLSLSEVSKRIINNPMNLAASCREHNDYFNIGFDNIKCIELIKKIYEKEYIYGKEK